MHRLIRDAYSWSSTETVPLAFGMLCYRHALRPFLVTDWVISTTFLIIIIKLACPLSFDITVYLLFSPTKCDLINGPSD